MIRALIETSLVDWDGKITTVLFFDKCNFMCPFCQNWELIVHPEKFPVITWEDIEKKLEKKKKWVDGVVLTGGEPLMFKKEVFDIARKIKQRNFSVKIDTNGAYPDVIRELLDAHLVDYVALDIKASIDERYYKAAGKQIDLENIKESIHILMKGRVEYEFRTTVVPGIIDEDAIKKIGESIQGASLWVLQTYVPKNAYRKHYRGKLDKNYSEQLHQFSSIAKHYAAKVKVRGKV